jgi:hypothetical protein
MVVISHPDWNTANIAERKNSLRLTAVYYDDAQNSHLQTLKLRYH